MSDLLHFLTLFFPPELSSSYLLALATPVAQSVGMATAAMTLAIAVSLPLGLWIGLRLRGFRAVRIFLTAVRAIPDLTLAILCVIAFGIGMTAGTLALAIYYAAAMGKMFGDLFVTAPRGPVDSLTSTGASRLRIALYGLLPLTCDDLLSYGSYEFESAIRASVIIGAVGGGGLGSELVGSLAALDYHRVTTQVIAIVLVVAGFDQLTVWLRQHPGMLWIFAPLGILSVALFVPRVDSSLQNLHTLSAMFPPRLSTAQWRAVPMLLFETIAMAAAGTALAVVIAAPLGAASARTIAPAWLAMPIRRLLEALRAVPEMVWGLLLVAFIGVGPAAGATALALHSAGCLGKLFAECFENVRTAPVAAVTATGATPATVFAFATLPLAFAPIAAHVLFRFDWNLRMATVVGMIGAGGIGQALYNAQQLFFYRRMMAYLMVTWMLVMTFDALNTRVQRRFSLQLAVSK